MMRLCSGTLAVSCKPVRSMGAINISPFCREPCKPIAAIAGEDARHLDVFFV